MQMDAASTRRFVDLYLKLEKKWELEQLQAGASNWGQQSEDYHNQMLNSQEIDYSSLPQNVKQLIKQE